MSFKIIKYTVFHFICYLYSSFFPSVVDVKTSLILKDFFHGLAGIYGYLAFSKKELSAKRFINVLRIYEAFIRGSDSN